MVVGKDSGTQYGKREIPEISEKVLKGLRKEVELEADCEDEK